MPSVRAKFRCTSVKENTHGYEVTLEPVTGGSKENEDFFHYTPYGELTMGLFNKETVQRFEVNKDYYLDFTPAE